MGLVNLLLSMLTFSSTYADAFLGSMVTIVRFQTSFLIVFSEVSMAGAQPNH